MRHAHAAPGAPPVSVLVVDDWASNRLLLAAALKHAGVRVLQAVDGVEGLDAIRSERPDVVVLDLVMPGMDGAEMMRRLTAEPGPRPRVLLLTAMSEAESAARAREMGVDAWLCKPFAPSEVRRRVAELLDGEA